MTDRVPEVVLSPEQAALRLKGVDHLAWVTWKPEETVRFYRDVLGLPLVHAITATGWVSETFPDFVHFFFAPATATTWPSSTTSGFPRRSSPAT